MSIEHSLRRRPTVDQVVASFVGWSVLSGIGFGLLSSTSIVIFGIARRGDVEDLFEVIWLIWGVSAICGAVTGLCCSPLAALLLRSKSPRLAFRHIWLWVGIGVLTEPLWLPKLVHVSQIVSLFLPAAGLLYVIVCLILAICLPTEQYLPEWNCRLCGHELHDSLHGGHCRVCDRKFDRKTVLAGIENALKCRQCGYDLRGSVEFGRCSECSTPFDSVELSKHAHAIEAVA